MTVPEPRSKPAYTDARDRVAVAHPLEAAALLVLGHAPAYVERVRSQGRVAYVYGRETAPALQQLRRAVDEVLALAERHRNTTPR